MENESRKVRMGDTIVLHYSLRTTDGTEVESTFGQEPVALTLGNGDMAEPLEQWLIGIHPGERYVFQLDPWQAFGESDPALIHEIPLGDFPPDVPPDPGALIQFTLPNGQTLPGLVKNRTQNSALVDFNHPLSDCAVAFEVEVVAIHH